MPSDYTSASEQAQSKQMPAIARLLSSEKTVLAVVLFTTALAISLGALSANRELLMEMKKSTYV